MGRMSVIHISRHDQRTGRLEEIIHSSEAQAPAEGHKIHTGVSSNASIHVGREEYEFYHSDPNSEIY